jgi:hypothetical protein
LPAQRPLRSTRAYRPNSATITLHRITLSDSQRARLHLTRPAVPEQNSDVPTFGWYISCE